jgi:L-rhamnose isomerase
MPATAQWTKESILHLIDTDDRAVYRALVRLYSFQTADEQRVQDTKHTNGVGFSAFDAKTLSDIAERCKRYGSLTEKQTAYVRRRIRKYAGQLCDYANSHTKE